MSLERTLVRRIPLLLLALTGCDLQPQVQQPLPTPRVIIVTATPTETPAQVAAPATSTPEPTAIPTTTSVPTPVNPAECRPSDVKQESEIFVAESLGVLRRRLPVKESDYDGTVTQNTRLITKCLRDNWYRVDDGKGGFWILSDYVTDKPITTPTSVAVQRAEPKQPQPEPKAEQKILLNEGLNRPLAQGFRERVNAARRTMGIVELKVDSRLQSAAEKYAKHIYANTSNTGTCSGQAVEVNCHMVDGAPWDRARREGYPSNSVWEVFMGLQSERIRQIRRNPSEEEIIATLLDPMTYTDFGLFNSPPHRETLLDRNNTLIGVGCYVGPDHYASRQSGKTENSGICIADLSR